MVIIAIMLMLLNYIILQKGDTPLHKAADKGSKIIVKLLLSYNANPNTKNEVRWLL